MRANVDKANTQMQQMKVLCKHVCIRKLIKLKQSLQI